MEEVCGSIIARMMSGALARAFDAWTLFTQTHKRSVQAVSRIVKHWRGGKLAVAFETWHDHTHEQVRSRGLLTRIAQRWRLRESAAAFCGWKSNADERQRMAHEGGAHHAAMAALKIGNGAGRLAGECAEAEEGEGDLHEGAAALGAQSCSGGV